VVNWEKKWKNFGQGWFGQPGRHSNAKRYGRAGGSYKKSLYLQQKGEADDAVKDEARKTEEEEENEVVKPSFTPVDRSPESQTQADLDTLKQLQDLVKRGKMSPEVAKNLAADVINKSLEDKRKRELSEREATQEEESNVIEQRKKLAEEGKIAKRTRSDSFKEHIAANIREGKSLSEAVNLAAQDFPLLAGKSPGELRAVLSDKDVKDLKFMTTSGKLKQELIDIGESGVHTLGKVGEKIESKIQGKSLAEKTKELQDRKVLEARQKEQRALERESAARLFRGQPEDEDADPFNVNNRGVFDPLGSELGLSGEIEPISNFFGDDDVEISQSQVRNEIYPHAAQVDRLVEDFYASIPDLNTHKIDNRYNDGVSAFERGDREQLVNAIMDIDAERRKLNDRKALIENVRAKVQDDTNVTELVQKSQYEEDNGSGFGLGALSGLFGGGEVSSKLAEQTNKINEVRRNVDESLQKGVTMSTNLRRKLAKIDDVTDYNQFEPSPPINVLPFHVDANSDFNLFNVDNVSLSGYNPLLGNNPAKKLIDVKVL